MMIMIDKMEQMKNQMRMMVLILIREIFYHPLLQGDLILDTGGHLLIQRKV